MLSLFRKSTAFSLPRAIALAGAFSSHAADAPATLGGKHLANPVTYLQPAAPGSDPPAAPTVKPPAAPPCSDLPADPAVKPPLAPAPGCVPCSDDLPAYPAAKPPAAPDSDPPAAKPPATPCSDLPPADPAVRPPVAPAPGGGPTNELGVIHPVPDPRPRP